MLIDSRDQPYTEIELPDGALRLTTIELGWTGTRCIRLQVRDGEGHLRPGPEVPVSALGELVRALFDIAALGSGAIKQDER